MLDTWNSLVCRSVPWPAGKPEPGMRRELASRHEDEREEQEQRHHAEWTALHQRHAKAMTDHARTVHQAIAASRTVDESKGSTLIAARKAEAVKLLDKHAAEDKAIHGRHRRELEASLGHGSDGIA